MTTVWRFHWEDESWLLADMTGNEVIELEKHLGISFLDLRPGGSARHTMAVLATFLTRTRTEPEVAKILNSIKIGDILKLWSVEDDDYPTEFSDGVPKSEPAGTTSITGSSFSPDTPGAGPQTSPDDSPSGT